MNIVNMNDFELIRGIAYALVGDTDRKQVRGGFLLGVETERKGYFRLEGVEVPIQTSDSLSTDIKTEELDRVLTLRPNVIGYVRYAPTFESYTPKTGKTQRVQRMMNLLRERGVPNCSLIMNCWIFQGPDESYKFFFR